MQQLQPEPHEEEPRAVLVAAALPLAARLEQGRDHGVSSRVHGACTVRARYELGAYMHSTCTARAQHMHSTCTVRAQYVLGTCSVLVQEK